MAKGIKRLIAIARANVRREIRGNIRTGSDREEFFSRALSGEGYFGGYIAALDDVILALNGNIPNRNGWWEE